MIDRYDCPKITSYQTAGRWVLKLPDPFSIRWFPLDAVTLAELLDVSAKTGQRLCQDPSRLRPCEVGWLQVQIFGLIPDPAFVRLGVFFQGGVLYARQMPELDITPGEMSAWMFERQALRGLMRDLEAARVQIAALEQQLNPVPEPPSNVIRFPGC